MQNYKVGDLVDATVTGIEKYGIFVKVNEEYTGLIHISEISYNFVKNVGDFASIGEKIKAKIIEIDEENKRYKLNIKDVDYKFSKKNYKKIEETPLGFSTLKANLNDWIREKKEELQESEKI